MSDFKNLPQDIATALDQYDQDITSGAIKFDAEGFAATYPKQQQTSDAIATFITNKVAGV